MSAPDDRTDDRAMRGYILVNGLRILSLGAVILGIAGARGAVSLPYALAVTLAVGGMLSFFFGPRLVARRFKSTDQGEP